MFTNLFLNSYKKKEDELTYAFFSMLELLNSNEFFEFLTKKKLIKNPLKYLKPLPVGNNTNPDGELIFIDENNNEFKLFFENKTKIRNLSKEQLKGHLTLCKSNDVLLVITPRKTDKIMVEEIKDKRIIFYTWSEIADNLRNSFPDNILAKQFIEYGKITGQFEELGEINFDDILVEIGTQRVKFNEKMESILLNLHENLEAGNSLFSNENLTIEDEDEYGRWGIGIHGKRKRKLFDQWVFIGYYYNTNDHGIDFKKEGVPEIAIFFDVLYNKETNDENLNKILSDIDFCKKIKDLKKYGFENNLDGKITENRHRLFYIRKPIDELDKINVFVFLDFLNETFEKIKSIGLDKHKYFAELL